MMDVGKEGMLATPFKQERIKSARHDLIWEYLRTNRPKLTEAINYGIFMKYFTNEV